MHHSSRPLRRWFIACCLLCCLLSMTGCAAPGPVVPAGEASTADRAMSLSRLDAACWYLMISQVPTSSGRTVTIQGKINIGQVSDVALYTRGATLGEAMASAQRHIVATVPDAGERMDLADGGEDMEAIIKEYDTLNHHCWETKITKNTIWTVIAKARRPDELVSRSAYVERSRLNSALSEALTQIKK